MVDFSKYTEAIKDNNRQPYCQVFTPSSNDEAFGIYIALDEAETAGFEPDDSWEIQEKEFKDSKGSKVKRKGYMLKTNDEDGFNETLPCRMAVVKFGPALVYQGTQPIAALYDTSSGERTLTAEGELAEDPEQKQYYKANKLVLYFLDQNLKPLSNLPFQLKIKGAFRGAFSTNYIQYKQEFEKVFLEQAKKSGLFKGTKRLDLKYLSLAAFKFQIGMRVAKEGTEVCSISKIFWPSSESVGKKLKSKTNDVTFILSDISDLFIDLYGENSEFAKQIFQDVDTYSNFGNAPSSKSGNSNEKKQQRVYELVQSLGWSIQEAMGYLDNKYGKTSRSKLSEQELNNCIESLTAQLPYSLQLYYQFKDSGMTDEEIEAFCLEQGVSELSSLDEEFLKDQLEKKAPGESAPPKTEEMEDIPF